MQLDALKDLDSVTANGVLAAAALASSPNPGTDEALVVKKHGRQASELLREVRKILGLGDSPLRASEQARVDEFLSKALFGSVFSSKSDVDAQDALARAGQSGRLSPGLYQVAIPRRFEEVFYRFGLKKKTIQDAIHEPDDVQHLLNAHADEKDTISLFMKRRLSSNKEPHWLLVQTHRNGITQIAQSAWRVFPGDVDLANARSPLDVLRSFVDAFGRTVTVGQVSGKFIESVTFKGDARSSASFILNVPAHVDYFASVSHITNADPGEVTVGIAYCIDLGIYAKALTRHGMKS